MRFTVRALTIAGLSLAITALGNAALAQGTLQGRITAQGTGEALQDVRVIAVGTSLFTTTAPDGKYVLRRVPAGTAEIRVLRVGYAEQKKSVRIVDGQTATLDFVMVQSAVQLQEVVATATGEQRRVEVGTTVSNIAVENLVEATPLRSLADVLTGRTAGV